MPIFLNKVLLIGNLTRDPDLRKTNGGQSVCDFSLAVNRTIKSKDGQEREETCFVDIVIWGKPAELCKRYITKGSSVYVEGHLLLDQWVGEGGERRSRIRVVGEKVSFLSRAKPNNNPEVQSNREYSAEDYYYPEDLP